MLQQDVDAAPEALLESREAWRAVRCGPNPVIVALALAPLALQSQRSERNKRALVSNYAHDLVSTVAGQIASVEAFLVHCCAVAGPSSIVHDEVPGRLAQQQQYEHPNRRITCTCHRVRISALIHT